MVWHLPVAIMLMASAVAPNSNAAPPDGAKDETYPVALCVVPEMGYIPEVDDWGSCPADQFPEHSTAARADWKKRTAWAAKHVTPELARSLSRWARQQMQQYRKVPPLEQAELKLVRRHPNHRKLVYELTVDTLPSHAPLVTRWLKVYLLYDTGSRAIVRVTITIRGERLE